MDIQGFMVSSKWGSSDHSEQTPARLQDEDKLFFSEEKGKKLWAVNLIKHAQKSSSGLEAGMLATSRFAVMVVDVQVVVYTSLIDTVMAQNMRPGIAGCVQGGCNHWQYGSVPPVYLNCLVGSLG